jgi:aminopeptidase N
LGVRGKEDIDIALDNMSGKDFSMILNRWYTNHGKKTVKVGIIQQNPEKSKHLETGMGTLQIETTEQVTHI